MLKCVMGDRLVGWFKVPSEIIRYPKLAHIMRPRDIMFNIYISWLYYDG